MNKKYEDNAFSFWYGIKYMLLIESVAIGLVLLIINLIF